MFQVGPKRAPELGTNRPPCGTQFRGPSRGILWALLGPCRGYLRLQEASKRALKRFQEGPERARELGTNRPPCGT